MLAAARTLARSHVPQSLASSSRATCRDSLALRGSCAEPGILLKLGDRISIACEGMLLACPFHTSFSMLIQDWWEKKAGHAAALIRFVIIVWATPEWECILGKSWPSSKEALRNGSK